MKNYHKKPEKAPAEAGIHADKKPGAEKPAQSEGIRKQKESNPEG